MRITRFDQAPKYHPPLHHGVECRRLQGHEAGPTKRFWVGLSVYAPGGAADEAAAPEETIYTVLEGELSIRHASTVHTLKSLDSIHLAKGDVRSIANETNRPATLLVAIATPEN